MKKFLIVVILFPLVLGCRGQFYRFTPDYNLPEQSIDLPNQQESTRVIFYNTSNILGFGIDLTDKIDIKLDHKKVGSIRINEYVIIDLQPKKYDLNLAHHDIFIKFSNSYTLDVTGQEMFVKVYNTPTKTKYKIDQTLPDNFKRQFKPIYSKLLNQQNQEK